MNKQFFLIIFILTPLFIILISCASKQTHISPPIQSPQVCYNELCFEVEIASTPDQRATGLMNRNSLPENKGMLFIFEEEGIYDFWMKNTLIPLDIVWIDNSSKIVYIEENAQPCRANFCDSITPGSKSKYVFEVNAGIADKINLNVGDTLGIKYINNR